MLRWSNFFMRCIAISASAIHLLEKEKMQDRNRKRERQRQRSRVVKIKNIKKQNLFYGCFKKQSTQKISNQKMKLKERDKSILEYVQCMYNNVHAYKVLGF